MNTRLRRSILAVWASCVLACAAVRASDPAAVKTSELEVARFGTVHVYSPVGEARSTVLLLSGEAGWNADVAGMAQALAREGALVAGIDVRFLRTLAAHDTACESLAVDFEALSHRVQKQLGLSQYLLPILVGYSSGATVAYATLAQSPTGTFAGAVSLGFCPEQDVGPARLCHSEALEYSVSKRGTLVFESAPNLKDPWIVLQGQQDQVCDPKTVDAFAAATGNSEVVTLPAVGHDFGVESNWMPQLLAAHRKLAQQAEPPAVESSQLNDLPLVEVPARAKAPSPDAATPPLAILLTGDGGWAGIDREVSAQLAAHGVPVVGFNTLRYFWKARTPEETARDVARTAEHYMRAWSRERVVLVGYSLGADVLPFVVNRLPADLRGKVNATVLIGVSSTAIFEIHVSEWLPGAALRGKPVEPELSRLDPSRVLCLYGEGEQDTLCPALARAGVRTVELGSGHHLGGDYDAIAQQILAFAASGS